MLYKQLPNIKQYNKNRDKIDPFCGNFEMSELSEVAYSGDYYDLSDIPDITSSDNSISITRPFSNDSDINSFDLTLNTSTVELIDFTNFHNYYIREVTDWTSENDATIKHYVVDNVLTGEELTIMDTSQAGSTNGSYKAKFKFERNTTASDPVYIPMICVDATDFEALVNVKIEFGDEGTFNTNVFILADTPSNFSWCFAKNIPFNIEGKRNSNQLLAFIEVPDWFTGSIEVTIKRLHIQRGSNIFNYKSDVNASLGYSYASFNNTNTYNVAVFTGLTGFTDIYPTANDNYGVLDVDFFVDSVETLEIQSDNSIPDWIVNTLYTNEVALRNRMNEIILRNIQVPNNIVLNKASNNLDDYCIAIGNLVKTSEKSQDESFPYVYTRTSRVYSFTINETESSQYYYAVTAGTTYAVSYNNSFSRAFTPTTSGKVIIFGATVNLLSSYGFLLSLPSTSYAFRGEMIYLNNEAWACIIPDSMLSSSTYEKLNQAVITYWYKDSANCSCYGFGRNIRASGWYSLAIGTQVYTDADYSNAIGAFNYVKGDSSTAIGHNNKVYAAHALAIGEDIFTGNSYSIALGYNTISDSYSSCTIGNNARTGYYCEDLNYKSYRTKRFTATSFIENNISKIIYKGTYGEDVTITVGGNTITTTPITSSRSYLIVIHDEYANLIFKNIGIYAKIDNELKSIYEAMDLVPISDGYVALWIGSSNYLNTAATTFSFLGLYKSTYYVGNSMIAIGAKAECVEGDSVAIGCEVKSVRLRQTVLGAYNVPDETALFIIGGGTASNMRKNILTIDDKEVMHIKGIANEIRTIDTEGNATNITNIQQGIIKVIGGGSITLSTSNTVEGLSVKIYASDFNVTVSNCSLTITAGKWHEFIFLDGAWRAQE